MGISVVLLGWAQGFSCQRAELTPEGLTPGACEETSTWLRNFAISMLPNLEGAGGVSGPILACPSSLGMLVFWGTRPVWGP